MSRQGIFTGITPNDGTGDSLLSGAIKVNQNFNEIYSTFGDGNNLISYVNNAGVATVSGNLTGTPNLNVGVITATAFYGDGSNLTGITGIGATFASSPWVSTPAGIHTFSNVGIGTTNPPADLSVYGDVFISGFTTFLNNVHIEDAKALIIGDNDELQIFHSGVDSYIDNASAGNLIIRDSGTGIQLRRSGGGESAGLMAAFNNDAGVELYFDSVIKLQTFQSGVAINDSVGIGSTAANPPYRLTVSGFGATVTEGLENAIADLTSSVDGYGQVNIRNSRSAPNASGDLVITADIGDDSSNFINFGINNTGFGTSSWTINGSLDGYLYSSDSNLSIGVAAANKYLSFFVGDTLIENEKIRVTETGVGIGTTVAGSELTVEGDARFSGIVTASRFESTSSGTPTIDSPNNLNINAVTVAISTDLTVGGDAYVGVDTSSGLILSSPNGTQYRLVVDNSGNLSTVLVP